MKLREYWTRTSLTQHLILSAVIRSLLILYGHWQDQHSEVPYTDIDYRVVTDGARYILQGESPFTRHTYRYSPILAILQIPSVVIHPAIGKFLYSFFDILVAILIYKIVYNELQQQYRKAIQSLLQQHGKKSSSAPPSNNRNQPADLAKQSALLWLYNPLTMVISTRGNGDSFSCCFVILTIYFLNKSENSKCNVFLAGISLGLAIHLRLYPILFSLSFLLCLSNSLVTNVSSFFRSVLMPNAQQVCLVIGTFCSLGVSLGAFYYFYGWPFLYESYLYHFVRKDVRHNFSLYFLMQYLSGNETASVYEKLLIILPQVLLLLFLTFSFGQFRQTIPFCIFAQTFVVVTYNSVVTSQYFVWYLALLPLCLNNLQAIPVKTAVLYFALWLAGQGLWLIPAYLLEFKTWNTFNWIGGQGVFFFLTNIFLLNRFIHFYGFTSFRINYKKLLNK